MAEFGRFVRVPTDQLEALLRAGLGGGQFRVVLWVIRNTYGWNRAFTPFTWYRVANEIRMNRSAVYRAGQALLKARILARRDDQLGVCTDFGESPAQNPNVAYEQQKASPCGNANVASTQRKRCRGATFFRPAKDSSKDRLKTSKDSFEEKTSAEYPATNVPAQVIRTSMSSGKYDGLSEN